MTIERWIFDLANDAMQDFKDDVAVYAVRQPVLQDGEIEKVELPSMVIKRNGIAQEYPLDEEDDDEVLEAAFTLFFMNLDHEQVAEMERMMLKTLKSTNRLYSATVGEDVLDSLDFYIRRTEITVQAA